MNLGKAWQEQETLVAFFAEAWHAVLLGLLRIVPAGKKQLQKFPRSGNVKDVKNVEQQEVMQGSTLQPEVSRAG